jgi:hypothetical protein
MNRSYYENLYRAEQRESEWRLLEAALYERRSHAFRRSLVAAIFWTFGIR